jgi:hypothetical protein
MHLYNLTKQSRLFFTFVLASTLCVFLGAQQTNADKPQEAKPQPQTKDQSQNALDSQQDYYVMQAGAGPCSLDLTVTDSEGKPVFSAMISVHMAYGFMGLHKLDLSVYTNHEGKARFTGLPDRVHKGPLEFRAKKDNAAGVAVYDPAFGCSAKHDIVLQKPKS